MKTEQWLAVFAVFVACGKSAESKQEKTEDKPVKVDKPAAGGGALDGFYKVKSATMNGSVIEMEEAFILSLKNRGDAKLEVDFVRMTLELEGGKVTVGVEQVFGSPGAATFCSAQGSSDAELVGTKLTVPTIEAVAFAGVVSAKGGNSSKDTAKCDASLKKGTYEVKASGKDLEISTTAGDAVTLHLVRDDKVVDLKARAVAIAARK
jgi:hypothetical protein